MVHVRNEETREAYHCTCTQEWLTRPDNGVADGDSARSLHGIDEHTVRIVTNVIAHWPPLQA